MEQITFNPDNEPYYSEDFIKGFKCGAQRQFEADMADRKTEPTISKMEQVEKDINVRSKDERQTKGVWNAGYKTGYDKGFRDARKVNDSQKLVKDLVKAFGEDGTWLERQGVYTLTLAEAKQRAVDIIESVLAKDEATTQTETQNSNLTFEKRTMRDCYNCKRYETEDECIECHYEPKDEPQDECAKEYEELGLKKLKELRKDEPQTNADQHVQHVGSVEQTEREGE